MISTRWQTGNSHLRETVPRPPAPVVPAQPNELMERPALVIGAALAAGIAIGLLVKWGFRR